MANLMLSVMGAFAEFERALIRERQREGIALAKQRGAYRGRKKSLSSERIAELRQRVEAGEQRPSLLVNSESVAKPCINTENGSVNMPRRSILSAAAEQQPAGVAGLKDDLIRHYTFNDTDLSIIRQRRASQSAGLRGAALLPALSRRHHGRR
ncbi:hypothetical protein ECZU23_52770 [Escherichia coli]|nr:hypothetical protein ECZU23_52770 [Escherichia coli]